MRINSSAKFLTALAFTAVLTGCGSTDLGGVLGGGRDTSTGNDRYEQNVTDVRGTVERVNTAERYIVVDGEGTYDRNNLRNGDDEFVLYYDDRTRVAYRGENFKPEDLEVGDRIQADVQQSGSRIFVEDIEVLQDVTSDTGTLGRDDNDNVLGRDDNDFNASEVRGTVRYVDTRNRTLEVDTSRYRTNNFNSGTTGTYGQQSNVVVVRYDTSTIVEFEGRRYAPENLERGDIVEIEVRNLGGQQLMAEEILVVGESSLTR